MQCVSTWNFLQYVQYFSIIMSFILLWKDSTLFAITVHSILLDYHEALKPVAWNGKNIFSSNHFYWVLWSSSVYQTGGLNQIHRQKHDPSQCKLCLHLKTLLLPLVINWIACCFLLPYIWHNSRLKDPVRKKTTFLALAVVPEPSSSVAAPGIQLLCRSVPRAQLSIAVCFCLIG